MAHFQTELMQLRKIVEEKGVQVNRETQGFPVKGVNMVFPYITMSLCLRGSGRAKYDLEEMTRAKRLIEAKPEASLKQTAYALGFSEKMGDSE